MAGKKGWQIGTMFVSGSWFTIITGILLLVTIIFSFQYFIWWKALLLIIASWLIAGILTATLRSTSQLTALVLIISGVVLYVVSFSTF
jgi:hypothetical protein